MKFIVSSSYLLGEISAISGVITTNPIVPILENFLFEMDNGILTVTASDLQTSMVTELKIEAKETASIAVPSKILLETLRNLPEQPVTFSIDEESYSIEINSDNGRYKLAGENATDFPKMPTISDGSLINIASDVLSIAISNTVFVTSNDELRPAMTGVYMNLSDTNTTFVATDGHRLVRYTRTDIITDNPTSIIIPRRALNLLKTTLPADNVDINVKYNVTNVSFRFGNIHMICRLIDERYPDYENVIPVDNNNEMIIDKSEILGSLKRIAIYANKTTHQVRLKITSNELVISSEDLDFSNEANERLSCDYNSNDMEIGFNGKFLIEMLNNISSKQISLKFSGAIKAGLIFPVDEDEKNNLLMLIMPTMLSNHHTN